MRTATLGLLALGLIAGCAGPAGEAAAPAPTSAPVTTPATRAPSPPPAERRPTPEPTPKPTPESTPKPSTVVAPCPYADAETVAGTVGQRIARVTVTSTRPYAGCAFYRSNGERAADIAVSVLATPVAAQTRALAVAGPAANPVDGVADGGAVAVTDDGTVLGVSRGRALVVVRINQRISLAAVEIAKLTVARL